MAELLPSSVDCARTVPETPLAPRAVRGLCLVALAGAAIWFARIGAQHINLGDPDFQYFYNAGASLLKHGDLDRGFDVINGRVYERGTLDWYWPCVARFMTIFALLPFLPAGYIWLALNLAAMFATLRLVGRQLSGLPPRDWPVTQMLPLFLLAAYWHWEFRLNQINNFTLLLLVGSLVCWERGRRVLSGFWLGLAVLLKLTPGLLILWFALKRQYRTAAAALLTVFLAGPVSDLIVFRPALTADLYRAWARNAVETGSQRGLILTQREMDWRNQGLPAVASRWLHPTNYNTHFDNDPRIQASYKTYAPRTINIVSLSLPVIATLVTAIAGATLVGLLWLARRPARALTLWQLRLEWALFVLAMLWFMPVMRRYHMIWALPAISLLGAGIHYAGFRSRWGIAALTCIGLTLATEFLLLLKPPEAGSSIEAGGVILASVVVLALPLVAMLWRLKGEAAALPQPLYAPAHPARGAAPGSAAPMAAQPMAAHA